MKVVTKLIQVRIKTHSGIWEKPFNIEETLEKIALGLEKRFSGKNNNNSNIKNLIKIHKKW